jgi:outer membrane lipoprotein-sorting protein
MNSSKYGPAVRRLLPLCILAACTAAFPQSKGAAQSPADQVLERMAAVGRNFQSFVADFTQRKYTAVLEEFEPAEIGTFKYARAKDGSALVRQEFKVPGRKILTISGGIATLYQPSIKQASIIHLGANQDKAEFLALGIGQSPARLRETFEIEYLRDEPVDGIPAWVLQLKPRSSNAAAFFSLITLWIGQSSGLPIQQRLQEPNGDYLLNRFSSEKLNVRIPESEFQQKLPKGVEIQRIR